jgi:hypothetical protein
MTRFELRGLFCSDSRRSIVSREYVLRAPSRQTAHLIARAQAAFGIQKIKPTWSRPDTPDTVVRQAAGR